MAVKHYCSHFRDYLKVESGMFIKRRIFLVEPGDGSVIGASSPS